MATFKYPQQSLDAIARIEKFIKGEFEEYCDSRSYLSKADALFDFFFYKIAEMKYDAIVREQARELYDSIEKEDDL